MKKEDEVSRHGNYLVFGSGPDRWTTIDPNAEALNESCHRLRYSLAAATQADAYRVLAAAEAYQHFAAHPAPTRMLVAQLRQLRRAVRRGREVVE